MTNIFWDVHNVDFDIFIWFLPHDCGGVNLGVVNHLTDLNLNVENCVVVVLVVKLKFDARDDAENEKFHRQTHDT
jgi:hypothetical protein